MLRKNNMWKKADDPPETIEGHWSRDVIGLTNFGRVFIIAFFGNAKDGVWQRLDSFTSNERISLWTEIPKEY